ncbi:MAG: anaerobic ribonucleoside-triphosphate reductase activating protein [Acidithiobacillus sp.]
MRQKELVLGGVTPLSTIDFPDRLAAVFYTQGCPLRCRYCHNPELWPAQAAPATLAWSAVMAWLHRRRGLLDAVVFSGGEPTAQGALGAALAQVRDLGFETALHTAGAYPKRLTEILPLLDWVGLDIKAPFDRYPELTGVPGSGEKAEQALAAVLASGVDYELRTTVHHQLLAPQDLMAVAHNLRSYGVRHWVLQEFRTQGCTDAALACTPSRLDPALVARLRALVPDITVRAAA